MVHVQFRSSALHFILFKPPNNPLRQDDPHPYYLHSTEEETRAHTGQVTRPGHAEPGLNPVLPMSGVHMGGCQREVRGAVGKSLYTLFTSQKIRCRNGGSCS